MPTKSGFVAVLGRPNVGKSALVNALIHAKVAIVSEKPQTTWFNVRGIFTEDDAQIVLIDTPGLHESEKLLNRCMTSQSLEALKEADAYLYVMEPDDAKMVQDHPWFERLRSASKPGVGVVNKIERLGAGERDAVLARAQDAAPFLKVLGVSALTTEGLDALVLELKGFLREAEWLYDAELISDSPVRFLAKEFIKEKLFEELKNELPYETAVVVAHWVEGPEDPVEISAEIWVNRESQKPIVIGKGGEMIKRIGTKARLEIEELIGRHVYLSLYVKVKPHWMKAEGLLKQAGFPYVPAQAKKEGR
jgi:GTP-binding protein Era